MTKDLQRFIKSEDFGLAMNCAVRYACGVDGEDFSDVPVSFERMKELYPQMWEVYA